LIIATSDCDVQFRAQLDIIVILELVSIPTTQRILPHLNRAMNLFTALKVLLIHRVPVSALQGFIALLVPKLLVLSERTAHVMDIGIPYRAPRELLMGKLA